MLSTLTLDPVPVSDGGRVPHFMPLYLGRLGSAYNSARYLICHQETVCASSSESRIVIGSTSCVA